jgi:putative nucleotidyltransferase with HDIG domain
MTDSSMPVDVTSEPVGWASHPGLARAVRAITFLVPVAMGAAVMLCVASVLRRPTSVPGELGWLVTLLACSSAVSWCAHRSLQRLLPLATLLEMSLCFPETTPSRLRLAQRSSSASELAQLTSAPVNESAQHAAERMLTLITALARHDRQTRGHAERVRAYTDLIATSMGLSRQDRDRLKWAALLHDIGKLHVPATLLNKPGKPDADEWVILRGHPQAGAEIAAPLLDWLAPMEMVIVEHHERWDGAGYPAGKSGTQLSEGSRIVQVADSFEVMTAARSYKRPVRKDAALRELVRCAGSQFDPNVVRAMVTIPGRKLLWAAGPAAWIAELPLVGQSTTTLIGTTASHLGAAAASAVLVATGAIGPASADVSLTSTPIPNVAVGAVNGGPAAHNIAAQRAPRPRGTEQPASAHGPRRTPGTEHTNPFAAGLPSPARASSGRRPAAATDNSSTGRPAAGRSATHSSRRHSAHPASPSTHGTSRRHSWAQPHVPSTGSQSQASPVALPPAHSPIPSPNPHSS